MSDDPFDAVLDRYFAIKGTWSLFEAICLHERIDPRNHKEPITDEYPARKSHEGPDFKVRLCKLAIGSIKDAELGRDLGWLGIPNLVGRRDRPEEIGAAQYSVDPRKYVASATAKWPNHTEHLIRAEQRYQDKKRFIGLKPAEKREAARQEFLRMAGRGEFSLTDPKGNVSEAAKKLEKRLTREGKKLYGAETLRKRIPEWVEDERERKSQDSD